MSYAAEVLVDSPLLYWHVNDTSGTSATDLGSGAHTGTYSGTYTLADKALLLPQSDKYAKFTAGRVIAASSYNPFDANSTRTFSCWLWRDTTTDEDAIFGSPFNPVTFFRQVSGADDIQFATDSSSAALVWTNAATSGAVHHVVLTYDDSTKSAELYVDSISLGAQTASVKYALGQDAITIAQRSGGAGWSGWMGEFAVFPSILSATRILNHYSAGRVDLGISRPWSDRNPYHLRTRDSGMAVVAANRLWAVTRESGTDLIPPVAPDADPTVHPPFQSAVYGM